MQIEILLIQDNIDLIHRSISTVEDNSNPFSTAINAIINELTGNIVKQKPVLPRVKESDKFKEAVPDYKPPEPEKFHPDLVKAGVAPNKPVAPEIPVIKLDMKTVFKDTKK